MKKAKPAKQLSVQWFLLFICAAVENEDEPNFNELNAAIENLFLNQLFKWIPIELTPMGISTLNEAGIYAFTIPSVVPPEADEVLIFATVKSGYSDTQRTGPVYLALFTQIGSVEYKKYIYLESYDQKALSTNSENIWFPKPQNGSIFLDVPVSFYGKVEARLFAAGYRVWSKYELHYVVL